MPMITRGMLDCASILAIERLVLCIFGRGQCPFATSCAICYGPSKCSDHAIRSLCSTSQDCAPEPNEFLESGFGLGFDSVLVVHRIAIDRAGHAMTAAASPQLGADDDDDLNAFLAQQGVCVGLAVVGKDHAVSRIRNVPYLVRPVGQKMSMRRALDSVASAPFACNDVSHAFSVATNGR